MTCPVEIHIVIFLIQYVPDTTLLVMDKKPVWPVFCTILVQSFSSAWPLTDLQDKATQCRASLSKYEYVRKYEYDVLYVCSHQSVEVNYFLKHHFFEYACPLGNNDFYLFWRNLKKIPFGFFGPFRARLKKCKKILPKRLWKTLVHRNKSKKLLFSITFSSINFFSWMFCNFSKRFKISIKF